MNVKTPKPEVLIRKEHVVFRHGNGTFKRYGYEYSASVDGHYFQNTCLDTIKTVIRAYIYRKTGSNRVIFTIDQI